MSIKLHGDKSNENMLIADTTVQEKNVRRRIHKQNLMINVKT